MPLTMSGIALISGAGAGPDAPPPNPGPPVAGCAGWAPPTIAVSVAAVVRKNHASDSAFAFDVSICLSGL